MTAIGVVAAGHGHTAEAAAIMLREGGNAFDAVIAALFAACVAEPCLASLGGGGFLLARRENGAAVLYDFFAHTPRRLRSQEETDLYPVWVDFGPARQEFHIGCGSIATPGVVKGIFAAQAELCALPMEVIVAPAVAYARDGVQVDSLQEMMLTLLQSICLASEDGREIFAGADGSVKRAGESIRMAGLADLLENLAREGEDLFYRGEVAKRIVTDCQNRGGHLSSEDFTKYAVSRRTPLVRTYRDYQIATNPPPSSGGILIAFGLDLLSRWDMASLGVGSVEHLSLLARIMDQTNQARVASGMKELADDAVTTRLLDADLLATHAASIGNHPRSYRGTTHISVIDAAGNAAAMSVSNGEGSGYIVPGTGIMLNNMLGEDDINPTGFHHWPADRRLSSMMSPTVLWRPDGRILALGSGGSKRIRTAVLQVLSNIADFGMNITDAVAAPRLHFEGDTLEFEFGERVENGFDEDEIKRLRAEFPKHKAWPERNMYFGGVHAVMAEPIEKRFAGAGDPRRGGMKLVVSRSG
jgi:gamma-glutamyltranspeptidase/glutathione hydrolase